MKSDRCWRYVFLVAICVVCALAAGCSDETVQAPDDEQILNPDKPNANDLIVSQATLGEAERGSHVSFLTPEHSGGYYFAGRYDSKYGVGRLSTTGGLSWFTETDFGARDICVLPPSAVVPNGLVTVGGIDTDGDDESEIGYVSLYGSTGHLLDHVLYTADTSDVWLNSIAAISDSTFVVVGGVRAAGATAPFVGTVALTPPDRVEKRYHCVIDAIPDRLLDDVAIDPSETGVDQLSLYVLSGQESPQSENRTIGVHKISAALPGLTPWAVEWSQEIVGGSGLGTYAYTGRGLIFFEGNLYIVGYANDVAKQPRPSNGGYWDSGLAASLTLSGGLRWLTSVALTGHSERFAGMAIAPDALYAVGEAASFFRGDQYFGYGLVSKIALETGAVVSNMTFGEDTYRSMFYEAVISANVISCGGYAGYELMGGGYVAWFCEVDVSDPPVTAYGPRANPAVIGEGANRACGAGGNLGSDPGF